MHLRSKKGFTLIEMLIVLAIIAMLASIVIVVLNPGRHLAQSRDVQRWAGVNAILNAVHQNIIDNRGGWTCTTAGDLPSSATNMDSTTGYDICGCLVPNYLGSLPYEPSIGSYTDCDTYDTGYTIFQNATTGAITVASTDPELVGTISVTR